MDGYRANKNQPNLVLHNKLLFGNEQKKKNQQKNKIGKMRESKSNREEKRLYPLTHTQT